MCPVLERRYRGGFDVCPGVADGSKGELEVLITGRGGAMEQAGSERANLTCGSQSTRTFLPGWFGVGGALRHGMCGAGEIPPGSAVAPHSGDSWLLRRKGGGVREVAAPGFQLPLPWLRAPKAATQQAEIQHMNTFLLLHSRAPYLLNSCLLKPHRLCQGKGRGCIERS